LDTITHVRSEGSANHNLGPLVATRKRGFFERAVFLGVFSLLSFFPSIGLSYLLAGQGTMSPLVRVVCVAVCIALLYLCFRGKRSLFRVAEFHQEGVVERCLGARREFRYDHVASLKYSLTRHYVHGLYCGTVLVMQLRMLDGRKLNLETRHKEHAKGLAIIGLGRSFTGEDEMDVIRDLISAHIATRLAGELTASGRLNWNGVATVTPEGITPRSGPRRRKLLAWSQFALDARDGYLSFYVPDRKRSVLTIPASGANCYPMLEVMQTLASSAAEASTAEAA
jgi:hypothetical protein